MKLLRFMSAAELEAFRSGELLENTTRHQAKTDAQGFCFLNYADYDEQYAYHFLSGIVSTQVVAIFDIPDKDAKKYLKEGSGLFADPNGRFMDTISVTEYSTERYHNKAMKLEKFCDDFDGRYEEDSFNRIFEWKQPDAPIKRRIAVVDKSTPPRPKRPDTPEQRLVNAIEDFMRHIAPTTLDDRFFDGFFISSAPSLHFQQSSDKIDIQIENLQITRYDSTTREVYL